MMTDSSLDELDVGLNFLFEELPEDIEKDEVDGASSKLVVKFVSADSLLPKCFINSENKAVQEERSKIRTVKEPIIKKFSCGYRHLHDHIASLLVFDQSVHEEQMKSIMLHLEKICNNTLLELYHNASYAIVLMKPFSYAKLRDKYVHENGIRCGNIGIKCLEAVSLDPLPKVFVEIQTSKSTGELIRDAFSNALVKFCSNFRYLRVVESDKLPAITTLNPSINISLLFGARANRNMASLQKCLSENSDEWIEKNITHSFDPEYEHFYALRNQPAPLLSLVKSKGAHGVQVAIRFSRNMEEMKRFYGGITNRKCLNRPNSVTGTTCAIYSLASDLELVLIQNNDITMEVCSSIVLCICIESFSKLAEDIKATAKRIADGHWETVDPIGNRVQLIVLFE